MKRLTKEELQDRARFNFAEEELELPEGSGEGVVLRTPSVEGAHALERAAAERKDNGVTSPQVAADLLATYCVEPNLKAEEWHQIVGPWPSPELGRLYEACAKLAGLTEEESRGAATEFRGS
jgi:hypothetical protein